VTLLLWLGLAHAAPDPLLIGDKDGLSFRPGLLLDVRLGHSFETTPMPLLTMQRARPLIKGTLLGDKAGYWVQGELAGDVRLLDAFVHVQPMKGLRFDAGRFLVPFSRAQTTPVPKLLFQEFSRSTEAVRYDRDVGAQVTVTPGPIDWMAGVFQGPSEVVEAIKPVAFTHLGVNLIGKVPYDETQLGQDPDGEDGLAMGLSGAAGHFLRPADGVTIEAETVGADVATRIGPTRLQAEGFVRNWSDGQVDHGAYAQVSVSPEKHVELATRIDTQFALARTWTAQGLVTWYQDADHLRLNAEYTYSQVPNVPASHTIALQQQLWF
jgi:hypothetical protein